MREIKFRARWRDTGKLIPDFNEEYTIDAINDDVFIVDQFTGLKDESGADIYEGDILKCTEVDEDSAAGREFEIIGEVVFGSGGKSNYVPQYPGSFCLISKEVYYEQSLLSSWRARYEVIGNIHDNPELLQ